jgi:hypothetical protein
MKTIKEKNVSKMTNSELAHYREELRAQLSATLEYFHRANLEINARYDECTYVTSEDVRDECARNFITI